MKGGDRPAAPAEGDIAPAGDDMVLPFLLEVPSLRGRLLRLGPVVDIILTRHAYPDPVARLLAEMLTLTGLLSSVLKFDGVFSLQTKGDGPIPFMVSDVTAAGVVRGYAEFDAAKLDALSGAGREPTPARLLGRGHLAFTLDRGPNTDRHQGIVELAGPDLTGAIHHYFRQSEQLKTALKLAVGRSDGQWRAGGLFLQQLPEQSRPEASLTEAAPSSGEEDDWRRNLVLMSTCGDAELLDPGLPVNDLLFRLFHEERVRVYEPRGIAEGCRCSLERIETILQAMSPDQLDDYRIDGEVVVTCQFCGVGYRFDDEALRTLSAS